jgi:hypothetical protein
MANEKTIEIKDDAHLELAMPIAEFSGGAGRGREQHIAKPRDHRERHAREGEAPGARR